MKVNDTRGDCRDLFKDIHLKKKKCILEELGYDGQCQQRTGYIKKRKEKPILAIPSLCMTM
jgi:hypothetical protein